MPNFDHLMDELGYITVAATVAATPFGPHWSDTMRHNPLIPWFSKNHIIHIEVIEKVVNLINEAFGRKCDVLFLGNELLLVNAFSKDERSVIIILPSHIENKIVFRIKSNRPDERVSIYQIPDIPILLRPISTIVITVGVQVGASYAAIPHGIRDSLALLKFKFFGEIVLLDIIGKSIPVEADGWVKIPMKNFFTYILTPEGIYDLRSTRKRALT